MHCSYLQIYADRIYDLLVDPRNREALAIREAPVDRDGRATGPQGGVFVQGLSEFRVASAADVIALVERGSRNRKVRATEANARSSRSHAILTLSLEVESDAALEGSPEKGGGGGG